MYFVIGPAIASQLSLGQLVVRAGFFGLVTYATYDLTNLATLTGWPLGLTLVDLAWGTVLSAGVSTIARCIITRL